MEHDQRAPQIVDGVREILGVEIIEELASHFERASCERDVGGAVVVELGERRGGE